jgi:hypothetical protein
MLNYQMVMNNNKKNINTNLVKIVIVQYNEITKIIMMMTMIILTIIKRIDFIK